MSRRRTRRGTGRICTISKARGATPRCSGTMTAGLVILQNAYNQLRIEVARKDGRQVARVVKYEHINPNPFMGKILPLLDIKQKNQATVMGEIPWEGSDMVLAVKAREQSNSFYIGRDEGHLIPVAENVDGSHMGSETAGGFVGAYIGMFASGNGTETEHAAEFDWFTYHPVAE